MTLGSEPSADGGAEIRIRVAGDRALVVELGDGISATLNDRVHRLDRQVAAAGLAGVVETVPTYRSLLVLFDPLVADPELLSARLAELAEPSSAAPVEAGRRWVLPVCFGGAHGEDLEEVARRTGLAPERVVELHCAADYRVYMLGFSPGFAYLGGLPPELHLPRRENPRARIPAGSIIQGGEQAAVSPLAMPSGWHILGRTPVHAFDLRRPEPFLLAPGDRVRFTAIDEADFDRLAAEAERSALLPDREEAA